MASAGDALTWITVVATGAFVALLLGGMAYTIYEDVLAARLQRQLASRSLDRAVPASAAAATGASRLPVTPLPAAARAAMLQDVAQLAGEWRRASIPPAPIPVAVGPVRMRQAAPEVVEVLRGVGFSEN